MDHWKKKSSVEFLHVTQFKCSEAMNRKAQEHFRGSEQKGKIYLRCLQLPIFFKCILMRIYYFYLIIFATTVASCLKALWGLTGRYQSFSVHFMSTGVCKGLESSSYHVSRWSARVSSLVKCWSFASIKLWHSKPRTMVLGYRCTLNLYML